MSDSPARICRKEYHTSPKTRHERHRYSKHLPRSSKLLETKSTAGIEHSFRLNKVHSLSYRSRLTEGQTSHLLQLTSGEYHSAGISGSKSGMTLNPFGASAVKLSNVSWLKNVSCVAQHSTSRYTISANLQTWSTRDKTNPNGHGSWRRVGAKRWWSAKSVTT